MSIIIRQPAGLGDILFTQKIAAFYKNFFPIVWPVIPEYSFIGNYLFDYDFPIKYEMKLNDSEIHINKAGIGGPVHLVMPAKYEMVGIDWHGWQEFLHITRNYEKEKLLYELINPPEEYNLICNLFASPPDIREISIVPDNRLKNIFIQILPGFNPFDWCTLIEKATELHFVDTCYTFIIEKLNLNAKEIHLYLRKGHDPCIVTKPFITKPWIFHD